MIIIYFSISDARLSLHLLSVEQQKKSRKDDDNG